jgi:anti-anti-sigma factor
MNRVHTYQIGQNLVIELVGEPNGAALAHIEDIVSSQEERDVIFDLSQTKYIDSTVLSLLVRQKLALGEGMRLVVPVSHVRRVLELTELLGHFNAKNTIEAAVAGIAEDEITIPITGPET